MKIFATFIALTAWGGLLTQFAATLHSGHSPFVACWILLRYFTITTNLLVAVVFSAIAIGKKSSTRPWVVGGTLLSILLVGVVYGLLLHGLRELSAGSAVANALLHRLTPLLVLVFWILYAAKGALSRRDPLLWAVYPLAYFAWALVRAAFDGSYPYPFMNVTEIGWPRTLVNAFLIACGFFAAGEVLVRVDRALGKTRAI